MKISARRFPFTLGFFVFVLGLWLTPTYAQTKLEIKTLSSRPDLVSGGDALIEIKTPAQVTLTLNGKDVTSYLKQNGTGWRGLISGFNIGAGKCNALYPVHSEPRLVAGAPLANDVAKCQLKPVNVTDYKVRFTAAQQSRMKAIFPLGVCDFSKPGVGQAPLKGTYQRY